MSIVWCVSPLSCCSDLCCFWQLWKWSLWVMIVLVNVRRKWHPIAHIWLIYVFILYSGVSDDCVLMPQTRGSGQREWVYYRPLVDISLSWTWWAQGGRSPGRIVWVEERSALLDTRNPKTTSMSSHMRCSATYSGQHSITTSQPVLKVYIVTRAGRYDRRLKSRYKSSHIHITI